MATENEQIIIDVVPDLDTRKFVQEYIEFGKDLKKLAKTVEGFLTQELKVNIKDLDEDQLADLQKQVTAISNKIIAEAKRMEREDATRRKKEKAEKLKDAKEVAEYELATGVAIGKANIKRIRQRVDAEASARATTEKAEADYFHRVHVVLAKRRQKLDDDRLLNLVKDKDAEAKMLLAFNKERAAEELALFRQQLNTKHTYRRAEIAKIRADRKAEDAWFAEQDKLRAKQESSIFKQAPSNKVSTSKTGEYQYFGMPSTAELQKAKTELAEYTAKAQYAINKIKESYKEAKTSINAQGTLLDPKKISDDNLRNVKAYKKAYTTGVFAWTPDEQQALDKFWKIKREQEVKEAIATGKSTGKAQTTATEAARIEAERSSKQKAPIGAMGVQVAPSGAFSSLATKQTYSSASDFKANASMEATARAAIAQSAKLGKQAAHEFNNSFLGSFMSGSSFGHKVGTTMQYMLAGAGIAGGAMAFAGLKDAIVEADKALGMFRGILEMSDSQAKGLQSSIFEIGKTFGGTTQDLNATALALGRAGVAGSDLKDSITAVSQMALVSGESLDVVTDLFVSWRTLYPEKPIDELANSMTAAANATKATIPDLATASNYLLTAGSQAGMTADALLAMEASLIQIGKSASTSGTEGRRFFEQMSRGSDEVKKAWFALGINVDTLSAELAKGGVHAEAAMLKFYETIGQKSKAQVQSAVKGIKDVLDVATIQGQYAISQANIGFKEVLEETKKNTNALKDASDTVALTYEKMFERIIVAGKESAVSFERGIVAGFGGGTVDEFNKNIKVFSDNASKATEGIGRIIGVLIKGIDVLVRNINVIGETVLFTGLAYGAVAAVTGISALSTAIVGVTAKQWLLNTAMNANPLGLVVTAAFAAATALEYFGSKTIDVLNKIANNNALKNFKKDLDLINLAVGPTAQLEVIKYLELAKIKQLNDSAKKYNEASGWFNATMSDEKKNLLAVNKAHAEELRQLRAKKDELKALQKVQTTKNELATVNTPNLGAGPLNLTDKDSGKAAREAQRLAQDALDAEIQAIREKYATIERNEAKANKLTEARKKELEKLEAYEKSYATDKAKGIDDWLEKSRKAHVEALDKETALYELANKANKEAAKKASITLADNRILQATNEYTKASAELSKAKLEAELVYNEELEKGTSESKAKALQEEAIAKATTEYQNKILELDKKRAQERIKLQQDTSSMLEENKSQQQAITDEYLKFLGYSERALELEQLKANVAKETRSIYREQESALASKYAGDKDVDTSAQIITDDGVIQKLSAINDKELQRLALMEYQAEFQKAFASGLDEQAINLDGILAKYQAIADKISNLELKVDIEIAKDGFDSLSKIPEYMKDWVNSQGEAEGQLGRTQKALKGFTAFSEKSVKNEAKNKAKLQDLDQQLLDGTITQADYTKEKDKIATEGLFDQIGAYGALAGAAAGFFEEGSKGAKAMQAISATLGIAQGIQAIISAWGSAPFPANMPAVAATTAAVLPMIGQLTSLGGSGGGSGGGGISSGMAAAQVVSDTAIYESEQANFIVDRLDRQIELLESIDQGGTAAKSKVSLAGSTFEADVAKIWADMIGSPERAYTFIIDKHIDYTSNALSDVQSVIRKLESWKTSTRQDDWNWLDMTPGSYLEYQSQLEDAVNSFAINLGDIKDTVKDSASGFKEIYDSLSGTDFYKIRDLQLAYEELGNSIVGNSKDSMLSYISNAVSEMERLGDNYLETTKYILTSGTIDDQVFALNELSVAFGDIFNNSTEEALNFLDSIELVAENIAMINEERLGLQETMDLLTGVTTERELELLALDASNRALQEAIWAEEDRQQAEIEANRIAEDAAKARQDALQKELDAIKTLDKYAKTLLDAANELRYGTASGAMTLDKLSATIDSTMADTISKVMAKVDINDNVTELNKLLSQYASMAKGSFSTQADYDFAILQLAMRTESLGKYVGPGFASGGYTGNMSSNSIAGVVHGREYVVNAQTTKDLGLNTSGGVFVELLNEVRSLKQLNIKLVADNAKMLQIDRAIYTSQEGVA